MSVGTSYTNKLPQFHCSTVKRGTLLFLVRAEHKLQIIPWQSRVAGSCGLPSAFAQFRKH